MTRPSSSSRQRALGQGTLIIVAVLAITLALVLHVDTSRTLGAGEKLTLKSALYGGASHEVMIPGGVVGLRISPPDEAVEGGLVDLDRTSTNTAPVRAAEGTRLLPVTWTLGQVAAPAAAQGGDAQPVRIQLVAGDTRVNLAEGTISELTSSDVNYPPSVLVAVDDQIAPEDITVEVTYDGLTQTLVPSTGVIDAGVAEALYEEDVDYDTGCSEPEDGCQLTTADRDSPWQPRGQTVTASHFTLHPYHQTKGWADEGHLWASVVLETDPASAARNTGDGYRRVDRASRANVTLDGAPPQHLDYRKLSLGMAWILPLFSVDADAVPHTLVIKQVHTLSGDESPKRLTLRAELPLTPER